MKNKEIEIELLIKKLSLGDNIINKRLNETRYLANEDIKLVVILEKHNNIGMVINDTPIHEKFTGITLEKVKAVTFYIPKGSLYYFKSNNIIYLNEEIEEIENKGYKMTRKELILNLLDGKKMTGDDFAYPDEMYYVYDESYGNPFRFINKIGESTEAIIQDNVNYREVKEKPYINPRTGIEDKAFVEAWDRKETYRRQGFYDAINDCCFDYRGCRYGTRFENYRVIKDVPEWAVEAKKTFKGLK